MKLKIIILLFFLVIQFTQSWSQIIITEVLFDTPYEENYDMRHVGQHHHIGEYIELYNYSNKDILLKGWSITDFVGKYSFPDDAVIKSGDFLIVAYRNEYLVNANINIPNLTNYNYFTQLFPNTVGQEEKIIYQDKIVLRNLHETLRLHIGYIGTTDCEGYKIDEKMFGKYGAFSTLTFSTEATINPLNYDFYSSSSVHLESDGLLHVGLPTPLEADYLPPIQDFETIPAVLGALYSNYNTITWEEYSNEILFKTCPLVINEIEQNPYEFYQEEGLCFNYDVSGNTVSIINCELDEEEETPETPTEYTPAEIEEIESKIILYPNPTYAEVNAQWDSTIAGKITQLHVSSSSGTSVSYTSILPHHLLTAVNLSAYPTGIYIFKFELDSGQFISKNIIKI